MRALQRRRARDRIGWSGLLVVCCLLGWSCREQPSDAGAQSGGKRGETDAATTAHSGLPEQFTPVHATNALARVEALVALGPRGSSTEGASRAADWIAGQLRAAKLEPRVDTFEDAAPGGTQQFHNVLAEIRPGGLSPARAPTRTPAGDTEWIVLLSHFDTKVGMAPDFQGANDGGSSTGLLLELAEALARSGGGGRHGVLFAFLDGEECRVRYGPQDGLHGSRRLAAQLRGEGRRIRAVVLLDMIGDRDLTVTLPRNGDRDLTLLLLDAATACGHRHRFSLAPGSILDDHQPFLDAGFPAINLIDFEFGSLPGLNDYWHTPADTLDKLSADSLMVVGQTVLELMRRL